MRAPCDAAGDGRYEARLVFTDAEGNLQRQSFYGRTSAEVRRELRTAQEKSAEGAPVRDDPHARGVD